MKRRTIIMIIGILLFLAALAVGLLYAAKPDFVNRRLDFTPVSKSATTAAVSPGNLPEVTDANQIIDIPIVVQVDGPKASEWSDAELTSLARTHRAVSNRAADFTKEQIDVMKAANPHLLVLKYYNFASGYSVVDAAFQKANPDLYLKDASGKIHRGLLSRNDNTIILDPGNAQWRQVLVDASLDAIGEGHDGIMADQIVMVNRLYDGFEGINPRTGRPMTTEEWRDAMYGALDDVKQAIGEDRLLIANSITNGPEYFNEGAERFLDVTDGFVAEGFKGPITWDTKKYAPEKQWKQNVDMLVSIQEKGGYVVATAKYAAESVTSEETLSQHALFTFASFMLGKGETSGFSYVVFDKKNPLGSGVPYWEYWTTPIGAPVGPYTQNGGVYMRDFVNGKILVNPSSNVATAELGEAYQTLDGETVTRVTMPAHTGNILTK